MPDRKRIAARLLTLVVPVLLFLCAAGAPSAMAGETVVHDAVLNPEFRGYPELGIPPHHFWQGATAEQCLQEGARTFLRLAAGKSARQRVSAYAPLAGQARLHVLVRGAGQAALLGPDGKGPDVKAKGAGGWEELALQPGDAHPPYQIELGAIGGQADFASVRFDVLLPAATAEEVADRILQEATWAVNAYMPLAADDVGPVKTAFDARRYDVVTGERTAPSRSYVCNLDMIPHTLQFLALLTGDAEWKAKFLRAAEDVLRCNVDANGNPAPRPTVRIGG